MDLLFKRYASPFLFLNSLIETQMFYEGIDELIKADKDDKWWEMYLATLPLNDKSFMDWKNEQLYGNKKGVDTFTELNNEEIETAVKNANSILENFTPPNK